MCACLHLRSMIRAPRLQRCYACGCVWTLVGGSGSTPVWKLKSCKGALPC